MTERGARPRDQAELLRANLRDALDWLRLYPGASRAELARGLGLSATSLTRISSALLSDGMIREDGRTPGAGRGRRATSLRLNGDRLYALGLCVGWERIVLLVMDFSGAVRASVSAPLFSPSPGRLAQAAKALLSSLRETLAKVSETKLPADFVVSGLGAGVPGTTDCARGVVIDSIELKWHDAPLGEALAARFGREMPIVIENDTRACLLGEKLRLGIPNATDTAYLMLGERGLATAATCSGQLVRGARDAAGEIAHISLGSGGLACDCGQQDCLQMHLVESLLVERARLVEPSIPSFEAVVAAYRQRLEWAQVLIGDFRRHVQLTLSIINGLLNPEKIIVGGSALQKLGETPAFEGGAQILMAEDSEIACARGAARRALEAAQERVLT